jgi:hypothetical protein
MNKELFTEKQRFSLWWVIPIILIPLAISLWGIIQQIFLKIPFGDKPAPDWALIASFLGPLVLIIFFLSLTLHTRIDHTGIFYRFFPVHRKEKFIKWEDVAEVEVRKYKPIAEYGGWGFRTGRNGRALNTSGNMGLQILFKNGKKLLIGTQKSDELKRTLEKLDLRNFKNS